MKLGFDELAIGQDHVRRGALRMRGAAAPGAHAVEQRPLLLGQFGAELADGSRWAMSSASVGARVAGRRWG